MNITEAKQIIIKKEISKEIELILDVLNLDMDEFALLVAIPRKEVSRIINTNSISQKEYEKILNFSYQKGIRVNNIKQMLLKESDELILFHGSKFGIESISLEKSRDNCDFGKGFYLSETYENALSFVALNKEPKIYSFSLNTSGLKIKKFNYDIEWMIAICYFRGYLNKYKDSELVKKIIVDVNEADLVIAPIADNKMFYIMTLFVEGDINSEVALHSLIASDVGDQYIIKSQKALDNLRVIDEYFLSKTEKLDSSVSLIKRVKDIETKLKLCKREYREGNYIEEILK